jgi:DNA-binding NtrC family response regulator
VWKVDALTANVAPKDIVLFSRESNERVSSLFRLLRDLKYRVSVAPPEAIAAEETSARPSIVYLGTEDWPREVMRPLEARPRPASRLLALDQAAFRWAGPILRKSPDFVTLPCSRAELKLRLERSGAGVARPDRDAQRLTDCAPVTALGLIGRSPLFLDAMLVLKRYAGCDAAVLIQGETGTGKELAARALHGLSARRAGPFVAVSCGAIPDSLVETELFGHVKGAFTDAREAREGLVPQALGGTLFLDEVEALSPKGQVALLRFLESHEYRPIGGTAVRKADLRVIAAGNEDFAALARRGEFRRDLLYRLNVLSLSLPPLRRRPGDAELIADHFAAVFGEKYGTDFDPLGPPSRRWLSEYAWPGNVRELENLVHRAVVTATGPTIEIAPSDAPPPPEGAATQPFCEEKQHALDEFERDYLTRVMRASSGNVTVAARKAGKERRSLGRLLKKHGFDARTFRDPD